MAPIDTLTQLIQTTQVGVVCTLIFCLVVATLVLERRFSRRTPAQRQDIIELVRAIRGSNRR